MDLRLRAIPAPRSTRCGPRRTSPSSTSVECGRVRHSGTIRAAPVSATRVTKPSVSLGSPRRVPTIPFLGTPLVEMGTAASGRSTMAEITVGEKEKLTLPSTNIEAMILDGSIITYITKSGSIIHRIYESAEKATQMYWTVEKVL
jgi:hypothetical protein